MGETFTHSALAVNFSTVQIHSTTKLYGNIGFKTESLMKSNKVSSLVLFQFFFSVFVPFQPHFFFYLTGKLAQSSYLGNFVVHSEINARYTHTQYLPFRNRSLNFHECFSWDNILVCKKFHYY